MSPVLHAGDANRAHVDTTAPDHDCLENQRQPQSAAGIILTASVRTTRCDWCFAPRRSPMPARINPTHSTQNWRAANARYTTERSHVTIREKFRRIVYWMKRYVEPMIEIVRADGPMRETFDETERLFDRARADALHNDSSALARNLRLLRIIREHSLRVFTQCRKEIQPLYESLRRSSFIAEGAARALDKLQNESIAKWGDEMLIGICSIQIKNVPGDAAITRALRRVIDHPPEPPPILEFTTEESTPDALVRRRWLDALSEDVRPDLPLEDLLAWLIQRHPAKDTAHILAALSELVFDPRFQLTFTDREQRDYPTADGTLVASPVQFVSP